MDRAAGSTGAGPGYRLYWGIWTVLLVLTLGMIALDSAPLARGLLIGVLLAAMLLKAALVAGYFMHLRYERLALAVAVLLSLLGLGAALYLLMLPDAYRILDMTTGGGH